MIRNVILAIVLICQLGVWFLVANPWSSEKPRSEEVVARKLEEIPIADVRRIEVDEPNVGNLRLAQREGVWCIEDEQGYPAIQDKVTAALAALTTLDRAEFRTDKAFLHEDLGVDERSARHLKLMGDQGEILAWLLVGKRDIQNNGGTFIRKMGDDTVYVSPEKELDVLFNVVSRNWYQQGVWDFDPADQQKVTDLKVAARRIEIEGFERLERGQSPDERKRIRWVFEAVDRDPVAKVEAYWRVLEPEDKTELVLDDLMVRSLVSSMLNMRSNEIIARGLRPEFGLDDPDAIEAKVTMHFAEDGQDVIRTVEIGGQQEQPAGQRTAPMNYVRTSFPGDALKQSFVYTISRSFLNVIQRPPEAYVNEAKSSPGSEQPR